MLHFQLLDWRDPVAFPVSGSFPLYRARQPQPLSSEHFNVLSHRPKIPPASPISSQVLGSKFCNSRQRVSCHCSFDHQIVIVGDLHFPALVQVCGCLPRVLAATVAMTRASAIARFGESSSVSTRPVAKHLCSHLVRREQDSASLLMIVRWITSCMGTWTCALTVSDCWVAVSCTVSLWGCNSLCWHDWRRRRCLRRKFEREGREHFPRRRLEIFCLTPSIS